MPSLPGPFHSDALLRSLHSTSIKCLAIDVHDSTYYCVPSKLVVTLVYWALFLSFVYHCCYLAFSVEFASALLISVLFARLHSIELET